MKTLSIVVFTLFTFMSAHAGERKEKGHSHTFSGLFQTGLDAIGGETTGTQLEGFTSGNVELKLPNSAEFSEKLNGSLVTVKGDFEKVSGIETGERHVLNVKSIEFQFDLKSLRGRLTPIARIGGETSGWQITTYEGVSIELALTELQKRVIKSNYERSSREFTIIKGTLVGKTMKLKGVTRKTYSAFVVQDFKIEEARLSYIPEHPAVAPSGAVEN